MRKRFSSELRAACEGRGIEIKLTWLGGLLYHAYMYCEFSTQL